MKRRRGGAVAAALKARKGKGGGAKKDSKKKNDIQVQNVAGDPLQEFLSTNSKFESTFSKRVHMIERVLTKNTSEGKVVLEPTDREDVLKQRRIDGMCDLVDARIERSSNYTAAFCLIVFFMITCLVLVYQRDVNRAFQVEGTMLEALAGDLPFAEKGYVKQMLTRSDDFYDWFEGQFIDRIFDDPACGNGVCEEPDEFPGFGRFGCIPDCGRYKKTTIVTVSLEDFYQYSKSQTGMFHADNAKASNWDLSVIIDKKKDSHPDYRWNVWSETMGDYIFAEHQKPTSKMEVELPDGKAEIRMFQFEKVSDKIDTNSIYQYLSLHPSTFPNRDPTASDWHYGDKFEAIAQAGMIMKQQNDYCWGGKQDTIPTQCESIPNVDTLFKALGSYGLKGSVTIPDPLSKARPPEPRTKKLAEIDFCGLIPFGYHGLKNSTNKVAFREAGFECPSRRSGPQGRHLLAEINGTNAEDASAVARRALLQVGKSGRYGTCAAHSDCDQTLTDAITAEKGSFCHRQWGCDTCSFCQLDGADAINGLCPKAYCPNAGGLPNCVSALRLTANWQCSSSPANAKFEISEFGGLSGEVKVAPDPAAKVRYVNPYNRLVGPIMITQKRIARGNCSKVVNNFIKAWASKGLDDGDGCLQGESELDAEFFGLDTAFVPGMELYDGNLLAEDYYARNERLNLTKSERTSRGSVEVTRASVPMGFFPYKYDLYNHTMKAAGTYRDKERDWFKLYFDTQITQSQAKNMLAFMNEGGFVDEATSKIEVEMIAFNAEWNRFTFLRFTFDWTTGGSITWNYKIESIVLDVYDVQTGTQQLALEIVVVILLGINILLEIIDLVVAFRASKQMDYFTNLGNLFDWLHFCTMGVAIFLWLEILRQTQSVELSRDAFPVLEDPQAGARVFTVDTMKEEAYLHFNKQIYSLASLMRQYTAAASVSIIFFVFRLLKALDFQPIMGIVTRTLWAASYDMAHFVVLYALITFGFAISGTILFGHQFYSMRSIGASFDLLQDIIISMDPGAFWEQMKHASGEGLFEFFVWGWVIVGFFLLINIFLAIIIDSYIKMKEENDSKITMAEEIKLVFMDWYKSIRLKKTQYMSDSRLYAILLEKKMGLPSTYQLRQAVLESLEEDLGIVLEGGITVNRHSMRRILRGPLAADLESGNKGENGQPEAGALQDSSEDDEEINWASLEEEAIVEDLMDRYAAGEKGEEDDILEAMRVDGMKRAVALFRHQQWLDKKLKHNAEVCERLALRIVPASKQGAIARQIAALKPTTKQAEHSSQGLLRVTLIEASELPRLDLMRAIDAYCLVFLVDAEGEPGEVVYRTEIIPHSNNPIFNEEFLFSLYPGVQSLSVLVYDDDCIDADDLVGSAQIELTSLEPWVPTERWCRIKHTGREHQNIHASKIRLQITLQPANANLDDESSLKTDQSSVDSLGIDAPLPGPDATGEQPNRDSFQVQGVETELPGMVHENK